MGGTNQSADWPTNSQNRKWGGGRLHTQLSTPMTVSVSNAANPQYALRSAELAVSTSVIDHFIRSTPLVICSSTRSLKNKNTARPNSGVQTWFDSPRWKSGANRCNPRRARIDGTVAGSGSCRRHSNSSRTLDGTHQMGIQVHTNNCVLSQHTSSEIEQAPAFLTSGHRVVGINAAKFRDVGD